MDQRLRAARHDTVQVKYTNQLFLLIYIGRSGKSDAFGPEKRRVVTSFFPTAASLSFSGSNQAREGRLVDALAVRGDEGRDTLR